MDPISDMLTMMRNAMHGKQRQVEIPYSRVKYEIARVFLQEGYIGNFQEVEGTGVKKKILVQLKYSENGRPVIYGLKRISLPSRRSYVKWDEIPKVIGGLGVAVISTPKGIMTDREARNEKVGGEVICQIW